MCQHCDDFNNNQELVNKLRLLAGEFPDVGTFIGVVIYTCGVFAACPDVYPLLDKTKPYIPTVEEGFMKEFANECLSAAYRRVEKNEAKKRRPQH